MRFSGRSTWMRPCQNSEYRRSPWSTPGRGVREEEAGPEQVKRSTARLLRHEVVDGPDHGPDVPELREAGEAELPILWWMRPVSSARSPRGTPGVHRLRRGGRGRIQSVLYELRLEV